MRVVAGGEARDVGRGKKDEERETCRTGHPLAVWRADVKGETLYHRDGVNGHPNLSWMYRLRNRVERSFRN
jgi:hypothetical protein